MSCFKILVAFIIAKSWGHHIYLQKGFEIEHHGMPLKIMAYIHEKWTPFTKIEAKSVVQKRELENAVVTPPVEEKPPAPVIEHIEEIENLETAPSFFGFQRPENSFNRIPSTRSIVSGLNTNIQESIPAQPQIVGEFFGGLPPRPIPITAEPIPLKEIVQPPSLVIVPSPVQSTPVTEVPPPALFNKTRVRQYAVYAGDVILKYISQFFNRARITFNRFTSPPPPTPVYEN